MSASERRIGTAAVNGAVNVAGSSTVYSYSRVSSLTRVNRSVSRRVEPTPSATSAFGSKLARRSEKLRLSTTSVSPSHRPRESPFNCRRPAGRWSRGSSGTMRASWTISFRMTTWSPFWKSCMLLL